MKSESSNALTWLSGIMIGVAFLVMSPTGSFASALLAALCAAFPALFGPSRARLWAVGVLVLSIGLVAWLFPSFVREQAAYSRRAKERATATQQEPKPLEATRK